MTLYRPPVFQAGLPNVVPDLIGIAGTIVLLLILVALAAFVYRSMTGGVDWPEDSDTPGISRPDDDELREGGEDDEWDYY